MNSLNKRKAHSLLGWNWKRYEKTRSRLTQNMQYYFMCGNHETGHLTVKANEDKNVSGLGTHKHLWQMKFLKNDENR